MRGAAASVFPYTITSWCVIKEEIKFSSSCIHIKFLGYRNKWLEYAEKMEGIRKSTYLLTPWCTILLEQLNGLQLVRKFPAFHGTRRFITALTSVHHLSLSWASPIQSIYPHPTSCRSALILSTHLRIGLPSGLFPSGFPTKTLYHPLSSPIRATYPAHRKFLKLNCTTEKART